MIKLTLTEKSGEPKLLTFDKDEITIGRVSGNDIVLAKGNVSKRHSRFTVKSPGQIEVADLKSTNGTYVNGRKIGSPMLLSASDRVYVGDFLISIDVGSGAAGGEFPPEGGSTGSAARRLPIPRRPRRPRAAAPVRARRSFRPRTTATTDSAAARTRAKTRTISAWRRGRPAPGACQSRRRPHRRRGARRRRWPAVLWATTSKTGLGRRRRRPRPTSCPRTPGASASSPARAAPTTRAADACIPPRARARPRGRASARPAPRPRWSPTRAGTRRGSRRCWPTPP